ncbi:hypothetical protein M2138_000219 [Dysgonomonadaceae bacterium PH5-43]|nr:hypothetical protein [Dysgonomonadaceae bacterium PH5-43]
MPLTTAKLNFHIVTFKTLRNTKKKQLLHFFKIILSMLNFIVKKRNI